MNRNLRTGLALGLVALLVAGVIVLLRTSDTINRTNVVGYFENSNGFYVGDDVRILGVTVGKIAKIEPQPDRVKVSFWYDDKYEVPADANAAVLSPTLVTSRAIQLTPAYTGGPVMKDDAVIPRERTVVPVEYDTFREQLERLAKELQPTEPGGVSPLGSLINTTADNLRGQGANIRDTIIKLSQSFSILGDKSTDIFSTVKNLHARAIPVTVIDQIPVSQNADIKIELLGKTPPTKRDLDDKRGVLAWELTLQPDEEKAVEFGYRTTWPGAKKITYGQGS